MTITPAPRVSQQFLATLMAEQQGLFAMQGALAMLSHPCFDPAAQSDLKRGMDAAVALQRALPSGAVALPGTFETPPDLCDPVHQAGHVLVNVRRAILESALVASDYGGLPTPTLEGAGYLVACRLRAAYAFQHFVQAHAFLGDMMGNEELQDRVPQQLSTAAAAVRDAHGRLDYLRDPGTQARAVGVLYEGAAFTVGLQVSTVLNLDQLLADLAIPVPPVTPDVARTWRALLDAFGLTEVTVTG